MIGTKLCGDVKIGGSFFHCKYGIVSFFQWNLNPSNWHKRPRDRTFGVLSRISAVTS